MQTCLTLHYATIVLPDGATTRPFHIEDRRIVARAPLHAEALDLRGHLVFPGLINAHDHLQLNNIPPLPAHPPFPNSYEWIAAFQPHFREPAVAAAQRVPADARHWQGGLKNLLCGATTVVHHDPWHPVLDDPAFPVRVLRRYGWSHSLGLGLEIRELEMRDWRLESDAAQSLISHLQSPLPRYGPPVHASFATTPPEQPWFIHLAEGTDARAAQELAQLDELGCLAANTVLVHGVGLTDADIEQVIARGAAVVWCPASNLALLGRTLRPRRLHEAGRLALGSDSRISGARDLLDEMRVAAACSDLAPAELLRLVTQAGRAAIRLPGTGGLAPGDHADLLIARDQGDPYRTLLELQRGDIRAVVRSGAPQIADPDFAGWFARCGIATVPAWLDGRPKLIARALLGPPGVAGLEPGLIAPATDD